MKIITFNWHTPYLSMLAKLPHEFDVAPPDVPSSQLTSWDENMRPLTPNVHPVSKDEAQKRIAEPGFYDIVLAHNVKDLMLTKNLNIPKLLVFHNRLSTEAQLGGKPEIVDDYRTQIRSLVSGVYCIFISKTKRYDWGLPGEIIMPGIDASLYGGYTGEKNVAIRVGNSIKSRALMTGYSMQEEVLHGLPNLLVGVNPEIPESQPSKNWDDLKRIYREHRLLLNTSMPPWEDGYNLAVLEAMATGMPVVSVANPTSPLTDAVDGFLNVDAGGLRKNVEKLLGDKNLAMEIGARGRETVKKYFPMDAFLEKWDSAIKRAYEWFPYESGVLFNKSSGVKADKAKMPKPVPGGKNIILSYTSMPFTAATYIEKAMTKKHSVLTVGCKITTAIIEKWNLQNMKAVPKTHDIHTPDLTVETDFMLERLPSGFYPDFFLWVETGLGQAPVGLEKLACPKVAYLIDTHVHFERDLAAAKNFDIVFLAQREYIPEFKKNGIKNVFWLPLGCDPETHGKVDVPKEHDVGFVGSLTDERRVALLQKVAERVSVRYDRLFLREMADFLCRSKIVFNNAIKNDLNMRVFEGLCSGSMLLTDNAEGLKDFFEDPNHLVIYNDDNIAELAEYYIEHEAEREVIAEAGRKLALAKHTYAHRVDEIVKVVGEVLK